MRATLITAARMFARSHRVSKWAKFFGRFKGFPSMSRTYSRMKNNLEFGQNGPNFLVVSKAHVTICFQPFDIWCSSLGMINDSKAISRMAFSVLGFLIGYILHF